MDSLPRLTTHQVTRRSHCLSEFLVSDRSRDGRRSRGGRRASSEKRSKTRVTRWAVVEDRSRLMRTRITCPKENTSTGLKVFSIPEGPVVTLYFETLTRDPVEILLNTTQSSQFN